VERLGSRFALHLVDLPRRFVLADAPAWVAGALDEAGLGRVHVIAHSMGGGIALRLAAERPGLVDRLVLVAPAGVPTGRTLLGHALPLAQALRRLSPSFLRLLAADAVRTGPLTLARAARDLLGGETRELLGAVRAPTLLVFGRHDTLVPPALGELYRAELRDARLLVLDAGHVPMYERPEEFDAAVLAFLTAPRGTT
jgi:pimeloyl-ACP methyl ester carboxylesterase